MPVAPVLRLGIFNSCKILNHLLYLIKGAFITCLRKTGEDKMKKIIIIFTVIGFLWMFAELAMAAIPP
jgi:hypothetical protein